MAKQVERVMLFVVLLCNWKKFVAESRKLFNFSCKLKKKIIENSVAREGVKRKLNHASNLQKKFFYEANCTKSCCVPAP